MKKFLALLSLFAIFTSFAQDNWCGSDHKNKALYEDNPALMLAAHEHMVRASTTAAATDRMTIKVPVVVHVIHDGGSGNISYEQIVDGIDVMNEDFNKLNADTAATRNTATAPFAPYAANVGIEFELAKLDPDGNCTNGVQRVYAPHLTNNADDECKYSSNGGLDGWPSDMYINIWVVNSIDNGGGAGITIGYAYLPYFPSGDDHGILYRHDYFGRIGTSVSDGEALTHEMGHILGLLHTFDSGFGGTTGCHTSTCTGNGDYCCDTPPAATQMFGCVSTENTCTGVPTDDTYGFDAYDQYENWMSYNSCQNMFSEDQKNIMLNNLTDIGFLENLVSDDNLIATGVGLPEVLCKAEFSTDKSVICAGNDIQFTDESYFNVTSWNWTFEGGTPSTSTDQNPIVTYNTSGKFDVTLQVGDGSSTESITATDYVTVLASPGEPNPFIQKFETMTALEDDENFFVVGGGDTWELTSAAGYSGTNSAWIDNFGVTDGGDHELISGTIDLSDVDPSEDLDFVFKVAYKRRSSTNDEQLTLMVSKDCGESWSIRKILDDDELGEETQSSPYTPSGLNDWKLITITNINSTYFVDNFRYKLVFKNDSGNNIYIDDIQIYPSALAGLQESDENLMIQMYPNPTSDVVNLEFGHEVKGDCSIQVINAIGEVVQVYSKIDFSEDGKKIQLNTSNLSTGIYFINVKTENNIETLRLVVE